MLKLVAVFKRDKNFSLQSRCSGIFRSLSLATLFSFLGREIFQELG